MGSRCKAGTGTRALFGLLMMFGVQGLVWCAVVPHGCAASSTARTGHRQSSVTGLDWRRGTVTGQRDRGRHGNAGGRQTLRAQRVLPMQQALAGSGCKKPDNFTSRLHVWPLVVHACAQTMAAAACGKHASTASWCWAEQTSHTITAGSLSHAKLGVSPAVPKAQGCRPSGGRAPCSP